MLTTEYTLVGVSNQAYSRKGTYYYYTELYAKAMPDLITGIHKVYIKQVITCSINSSFYLYPTTNRGEVNGVEAFSGINKPDSAWDVTSNIGTKAKIIGEGAVDVDCTDGLVHTIPLRTEWKFTSGTTADYTPNTNATLICEASVSLPAIPRRATLNTLNMDTGNVKGNIRYNLIAPAYNMRVDEKLYFYTDGGNRVLLETKSIYPAKVNESIYQETSVLPYIDTIYNAVKNRGDVVLEIVLDSYINNTYIDSYSDSITPIIPPDEDIIPRITDLTVVPVDLEGNELPLFVQGKTAAKISYTAEYKYGASKKMFYATVEGVDYKESPYISSAIMGENDLKIVGTLTDSRNFVARSEETVFVHSYSPPTIRSGGSNMCYRCNEEGEADEKGEYLYFRFDGEYSSNVPSNMCVAKMEIRRQGGEWSDAEIFAALDANNQINAISKNLHLNPSETYNVRITLLDDWGIGKPKTAILPAERADVQYDGNTKSWSFGEKCPIGRNKAFSLGNKLYLDGGAERLVFVKDINAVEIISDEDMLILSSQLMNYSLFFVFGKKGNVEHLYLGYRGGNSILMFGTSTYLQLKEGYINIIQGDAETFEINKIEAII